MIDKEEIVTRLERVLNAVKPITGFRTDGHLRKDFSLDSLDVMMFFFEVEKQFDIQIREEDVGPKDLLVIGHLADYIHTKLSPTS